MRRTGSPSGVLVLLALAAAGATAFVLMRQRRQAQREAPMPGLMYAPDTDADAAPAPYEAKSGLAGAVYSFVPGGATARPKAWAAARARTDAASGLAGTSPSRAPQPTPGLAARPEQASAPGALASRLSALEPRFRELNAEFMKRHPAVAQYEREWMSDPELRRLRDDFMAGHDPVRFVQGLAQSKSFAGLLARYAPQPGIQAFAKEALKNTPNDVLGALAGYLNRDSAAAAFVYKVAGAMGLGELVGPSGTKLSADDVRRGVDQYQRNQRTPQRVKRDVAPP